jgi:hypothetical protein
MSTSASPSVRFALRFGASWALPRVTMPVGRLLSGDLAAPDIHIPEQYGGAGFGMV